MVIFILKHARSGCVHQKPWKMSHIQKFWIICRTFAKIPWQKYVAHFVAPENFVAHLRNILTKICRAFTSGQSLNMSRMCFFPNLYFTHLDCIYKFWLSKNDKDDPVNPRTRKTVTTLHTHWGEHKPVVTSNLERWRDWWGPGNAC
jgi:hypothetical protein